MRYEDLVPRQLAIVESEQARTLVLGGPGTGKTTAALWAARRAIEGGKLAPHERVLFLAFTKTAVAQVLKNAPAVLAGLGDRVEVLTYHALAWRLVESFGRYAGYGSERPRLQSSVRVILLGRDEFSLTYDDLVPAALELMGKGLIGDVVRRRWPYVICDEAQDTTDQHQRVVDALRPRRVLMLADPEQLIYKFIKGVDEGRLTRIREASDEVIQLEARSHRDPSGAIPALAEAIRRRDFRAPAIVEGIAAGRLRVVNGVAAELLPAIVAAEVRRLRTAGMKSIGVYGKENESVAALGAQLAHEGIQHVLVGLPEAQGEALNALVTLCEYGVGARNDAAVRESLATFVAACSRGGRPPGLAVQLYTGDNLSESFRKQLSTYEALLRKAASQGLKGLATVASRGWKLLGFSAGQRPWQRAVADFAATLRLIEHVQADTESVAVLRREIELRRPGHLVDMLGVFHAPVQLMNFHQTKGREADAVILVFQDGEWYGHDAEPFTDSSRVLYVALTRARREISVILPDNPHALVAPLQAFGTRHEGRIRRAGS